MSIALIEAVEGVIALIAASGLCLVIGAALAFWGYKLHARFPFLPGSWSGAVIGSVLGYGVARSTGAIIGAITGAILLGFICATVSKSRKEAGTFLVFFSGCLGLFALGSFRNGSMELRDSLVFLIFSVLFGLVAVNFHPRTWIIVATSLVGALLLAIPGCGIASALAPKTAVPAAVFATAFALAAGGGIYVQASRAGVPEHVALPSQTPRQQASVPTAARP